MEQSTVNLLGPYMPMVKRYESQFASLNTLLSKTTLTGKISSLDIAENLFDYMEKTQEKFENLQDKLIETIMEQNFLNAYEEAETSVKIVAQTLNFYFKNRHEDISTLAKSQHLLNEALNYQSNKAHNAQKADESLHSIVDYLERFGASGDVYKSVMLYGSEGALVKSILNKNGQNFALKTKMNIVTEGSGIEYYGEFCQKVDFYVTRTAEQDESLEFFFVIPIRQSKEFAPIFTAVFVVDLKEEFKFLQSHFTYRLPQSNLVILNAKNNVIYSDNKKVFQIGQLLNLTEHGSYSFLENRSKVCLAATHEIGALSGIQSISQSWKVCRIVPLYVVFDPKRQPNYDIEPHLLENSLLITEDLDTVIAEGENINEELGDVVINGEIIASKSHSYALNPILNNIRILSEEMNTLCIQSTGELQKGIYSALFNVVGYYAQYSTLLLDYLFKECVKDSNWIANMMHFRRYFSELENGGVSGEVAENAISLLKQLKDNYANFYNIILFDKSGHVLHNSLDNPLINGHKIEAVDRLGGNSEVIVSNFGISSFYENKKTILFYAGIKSNDQRLIGGVAYVLDLDQVEHALKEALPKESAILSERSEIFSVVFDNQKNIISSTKEGFDFNAFSNGDEFDFKNLKNFKKIVKIGQKYFLICAQGLDNDSVFVEYTRRPLYAMIYVAVKEEEIKEYV